MMWKFQRMARARRIREHRESHQREIASYVPVDELLAAPAFRVIRALRWFEWVSMVDLLDALDVSNDIEFERYRQAVKRHVAHGRIESAGLRPSLVGRHSAHNTYRITDAGRSWLADTATSTGVSIQGAHQVGARR